MIVSLKFPNSISILKERISQYPGFYYSVEPLMFRSSIFLYEFYEFYELFHENILIILYE